MNNIVPIFLSVMMVLSAIGCKSSKQSVAETPPSEEKVEMNTSDAPQLLASISRTPCYGQCPIYKATFMDNGEVIYIGKRFVDKIGTYRTLIPSEDVDAIKKKVIELDYFQLDSLYPTLVTDFPSCITEVQLDGKRKTVIDRRGGPDNLKAFQKFLDRMLANRKWEKVSDNTEYTGPSY